MVELISYAKNLEKLYYKVFRSTDPFVDAGQPILPIKAVIYPTYGYHLKEQQFEALKGANKAIGSIEFFISQIEHYPANPFVVGEHWKCIDPSFEEYNETSIALENAIYSADGSWGFLISHEDHALIVSDLEFWEAFKKLYSDLREDYYLFLNYWKQVNEGKSWLDHFLASLTVKP